ncbi:tryptophanyl-tRNA synthetase [Caldisphaera lagunensis DSM 15908]|uniref:Tryptophan--tRNA ligase n=1 Tax=Caldisphaera lagunensis (strain DSM 15908 / JCM 11604 / ANMR 0165 / IC-154) TaxID=1056495 RepID=L0ABX0_CALLD|nr:tryptophan--tRNA ligase [Caldisphaera lagunensis]AFZ70545.1 tryptophanyl-tRNA synthetase [Caldisphaera lagunensis DSM 15908]
MSEKNEIKLDPWGRPDIKDYSRLYDLFGIRPFNEVIDRMKKDNIELSPFIKRGIIFGHRDFDSKILKAIENKEKVAAMTGFMPSGRFHFGHMMTGLELIYFQKLGFKIFVGLADAEAYAVRHLPRKDLIRIGIEEYVANLIALGLDPKETEFYFQTNRKGSYHSLIQLFSSKITFNELEAIYGDITPGKIVSALTQAADILHPQLPEYGEYKHVVVPVGADQDPHLRLTRDLADRFKGDLDLEPPASIYHRLIRGLDGGKMSSSKPDVTIFLTDPIDQAKKKFMSSLTGGRNTAEEQRRLGGEPEKCPVYDLYLYHLVPDDVELTDIYKRCKSGSMLCGECKLFGSARLEKFLTEHQKKLEKAKDIAWSIVEIPKI